MWKRGLDLLLSFFSLLALSPLLLAVSVWVKCDSPGPIIFRQQRVGRGGRLFVIFKFRSMHTPPGAHGSQITVGNDSRITRAGAFLRRTKVDELPQLWNVLRGDMSIVGPRPEVPQYVALYPPAVRDIVLSVRPGITDLASLAFRDESTRLGQSADPEATYVEQILPIKLRYCTDYVQNQSLWLDIKIIIRTVWVLLGLPDRNDQPNHPS